MARYFENYQNVIRNNQKNCVVVNIRHRFAHNKKFDARKIMPKCYSRLFSGVLHKHKIWIRIELRIFAAKIAVVEFLPLWIATEQGPGGDSPTKILLMLLMSHPSQNSDKNLCGDFPVEILTICLILSNSKTKEKKQRKRKVSKFHGETYWLAVIRLNMHCDLCMFELCVRVLCSIRLRWHHLYMTHKHKSINQPWERGCVV